jgi:hypothetical protein
VPLSNHDRKLRTDLGTPITNHEYNGRERKNGSTDTQQNKPADGTEDIIQVTISGSEGRHSVEILARKTGGKLMFILSLTHL